MEKKMNEIDNNESLITFLKQALDFYANKNNYKPTENGKTYIQLDGGEQARFALNQIDRVNDVNKTLEDNFLDEYKNINNQENTSDINELRNKLEELKKQYGDGN